MAVLFEAVQLGDEEEGYVVGQLYLEQEGIGEKLCKISG